MSGRKANPEKIRVSLGTAAVLGLTRSLLSVPPTTAYLMTYIDGRCSANCSFCAQARESSSDLSLLSRIEWPAYTMRRTLEALSEKESLFKRVCLQTLNHPGYPEEVAKISERLRENSGLPLSVCMPPVPRDSLGRLASLGVDRVCFALDGASSRVFEEAKGRSADGPYAWQTHLEALEDAVDVFACGRVTTHLVVGLGESEEELLQVTQRLTDQGILVSLFAFTPIPGTRLARHPRPSLSSYRRVQAGRHLITEGIGRFEDMCFEKGVLRSFGLREDVVLTTLRDGKAFETRGCPGCNRPFYNETPLGPIYNYPRPLTGDEVHRAISEMKVRE